MSELAFLNSRHSPFKQGIEASSSQCHLAQKNRVYSSLSALIVCGLLSLFYHLPVSHADVGGTPQTLFRQFQVFGGAEITGNTLMGASASNPLVNSRLLSSSPGDITDIPFDAQIEGAFLFWSASTLNTPDQTVDLTLPNGVIANDVLAERCLRLNSFGGFFACRADVTTIISTNPGVQSFNGRYTVSDLSAEPGTLNPDGSCVEVRECQAKYAAWSLVLIYSSPSSSTLRDVTIYDGFRSFDETPTSPGIAQYSIGGFDFPTDGRASLSYLGMEGDALLGVPPQDTDPNQQLRCNTCFDFFEVNGTKLNDANNPPNNVFNSSSEIGYTLGVDLDTFDISNLLTPGDSVINLRVGSGDGRVNPTNPDPGGGGELFLLSYIVLNVDRNAPNFNRDGTEFTVIPDEAAPLERVVFTLRVQNQGSLTATGVNTQVTLPVGLTYFPGSLRIDGVDPIPGQEQQNPLATGYNLGQLSFQGDNDRIITFRASIDQGVVAGTQLISQAVITAINLMDDTSLRAIVNVLGVPPLGQATKSVIDGDGDDLYSPGEIIQYRINIPNPNNRPISGVRLIDQIPPYLDVLQVISGGGIDNSDLSLNRVQLDGLNIDATSSITVIIVAQIHDNDQLEADGIAPAEIDGFLISNQAEISLGSERVFSDDPSTNTQADATIFLIDAGVDIRGNGTRKEVSDLNGGRLEPGDQVQYSIRIRNTGTNGGSVRVRDTLPPNLDNCVMISAPAGITCDEVSGRWQIDGVLDVLNDDVVRVTFNATVKDEIPGGTAIINEATLSVIDDPQQVVTIRSPQLVVFSAPNIILEKQALSGTTIPREGTVRYQLTVRNTGNREATALSILDPIRFSTRSGEAQDGGELLLDDQGVIQQAQWTIPSLAADESLTLNLELDLSTDVQGGALLSNQARLTYEGLSSELFSDDPSLPGRNDPTVISVTANGPALSLTKSVVPRDPLNNQRVTYTLILRNVGDEPLVSSQIRDRLPANLTDIRAQGAQINGNDIVFNQVSFPALAIIDPGQTITFRINAQVSNASPGLAVSNQASASAESLSPILSDDPTTPVEQDPTTFTVATPPALTFTKSGQDLNGEELNIGDTIRYTLTLSHREGATANEITVIDPVPFGLTNVSPLDGGRLLGDQILWTVDRLGPEDGEVSLRFEATVSAQVEEGERVSNQASVRALNMPQPSLSDDPTTAELDDPTILIVSGRAQLSLAVKRVEPQSAAPGELVTWTIEVENQGPSVARSVVVTDPLARLLTEVEAVGGRLSGGQAIWDLGNLGVNQRRTLTLRSRLSERAGVDDLIANQARVSGDNFDDRLTDDLRLPGENDPTVVTVSPPVQLLFTKALAQESATARPGDALRYLIVLRNIGETPINNLIVLDQLPPSLRPISASVDGQITGDTATWTIPILLPNAERTLVFEVQVSPIVTVGTSLPNQASVTSAEGINQVSDDPRTAEDNDPTVVRIIGDTEINLRKSVIALDNPSFRRGSRIRYELELNHIGNVEATDVVVSDPIPLGLTDVSSESGDVSAQQVRWTFPRLAAGVTERLRFEATVSDTAGVGDVIANQAEVRWEEGGSPVLSDDPATPQVDPTVFTVLDDLRLRFTKTVAREDGRPVFAPNALIIYELILQNDGPGEAAPRQVTDILSPSLIPVTERPWVSESGLVANLSGNTVTWDIPALAEGERAVMVIGARLASDLLSGSLILNQAEVRVVDQPNTEPLLSDDPTTPALSDPTALVISTGAFLKVEKSLIQAESVFAPGETVSYQLVITNEGDTPTSGLILSDSLPDNLSFVEANPAATVTPQGLISWSSIDLVSGGSATFVLRARLSSESAEGTIVSNQARLLSELSSPVLSDDPSTSAPNDATSFRVSSSARLTLEKTVRDVNGGELRPGELVEFELIIRNLGAEEARDIEVIDPLSPLLVDSNPIGGQVRDQIARWRILRLQPGDSVTLILSARVSNSAQGGDLLTNQFAARETGQQFTLSEEVSLTVQVDQFTFEKRARPILADQFTANAQIEYLIEVTNTGQSTLENIIISDQYPAEQLSDIRPGQGGLVNGSEIVWDANTTPQLASIDPGQTVELSIGARIIELPIGTRFNNQATLRLSGGDPTIPPVLSDDPSTPESNDPTTITIANGQALAFVKDLLRPADRQGIRPGDEIEYVIQITNLGQSPSVNITVGDVLDPTLRLLNVSVNGVSRDPLSLIRGSLVVDPIPPSGSVSLSVIAQVDPMAEVGQSVFNQATLAFETNSGIVNASSDDPKTPESGDPTSFIIGGESSLSMVKTARLLNGETIGAENDLIEWTILLENRGDSPVFEGDFIDPLPPEVSYEPQSIRAGGQALTDLVDIDRAAWVEERREVRINVPTLAPQERFEIKFLSRVKPVPTRGPFVTSNQALWNIEGGDRLESDNDEDPSNGVSPTSVLLAVSPEKSYEVSLSFNNIRNSIAQIGERVDVDILAINTGSIELNELELSIPIPNGYLYQAAQVMNGSAEVIFEPTASNPMGSPLLGTLRVKELSLAIGEEVRVSLELTVDPDLTDNRELCLIVRLSDLQFDSEQDIGEGFTLSREECIEGQVVFGRLSGNVFQDFDNNQIFDEDTDLPLEGMVISLWRLNQPEGEAIATNFSAENGEYFIENLRPGRYELRLKSSQGVAFSKRQEVEVIALEEIKLPLTVEPTGRVYDSVKGDLIDGAQVFLYRDEDLGNEDPYDDASLEQRTLVPESVFASPTQQGQRTAQGGMYRFDINEAGRYLIEVIPPGVRYVAPSSLVPPLPTSLTVSGQAIQLVSSPLPSADPSVERRYILAFEVTEDQLEELKINHNHIPLDPLSSLIQIDKRSRRVQHMVGDIVTYEVDIINRSPQDLVYDSQRLAGGVYIEDVLPKGFKYVAQSAVWVEVSGVRERPLFAAEPSGYRILRFGRDEEVIQTSGEGDQRIETIERVQRPIDLKAGGHLRLRYQVVVGPQAKPMRSYTNRARVLADGDIPISAVAKAKVQIVADPDFDQGLLLGRVWCDEDKDGLQDLGEKGLVGAKVYFDSGMYSVTDSRGKYHFKMIDPGSHGVKIDRGSLLPGAELTTDEMRVIYFTRGLPAKVDFGVTCPVKERNDPMVQLGDLALKAALTSLGREAVILSGDTQKLTLKIGDLVFSAPPVDVQLEHEGEVPDVIPPPEGAPLEPLFFKTKLPTSARSDVKRWTLWVGRDGAEERPVLSGLEAPPLRIEWDGRDLKGAMFARRGRVLSYRLEVITEELIISSPHHRLGVGVTLPPEPEVLLTFPTSRFDVDQPDALSDDDLTRLTEVIARLKGGYEGRLLVDVHGSGESDASFFTGARAASIAQKLTAELKLKEGDIQSEGSGNQFPLIPNLTQVNRRRNRRALIRLEQLTVDEDALDMLSQPAELPAIVRSGEAERQPDSEGRFIFVAEIGETGVIEVYLRNESGASVTFSLPLDPSAAVKETKDASISKTQPLSLGGIWGSELSLGGTPLSTQVAERRLALLQSDDDEVKVAVESRLLTNLKSDDQDRSLVEITSWSFITIEDGQPLVIEQGSGEPPKILSWSPLDPLTETSKIGLQIKLSGQIIPSSTQDRVGLKGPFESISPVLWLAGSGSRPVELKSSTMPTQRWRMSVGGESIEGETKSRVEKVFTVPSMARLDFTIIRPDESKLTAGYFMPQTVATPSNKLAMQKVKEPVQSKPSSSISLRGIKVTKRREREMSLWAAGGLRQLAPGSFVNADKSRSTLRVDLRLPSEALTTTKKSERSSTTANGESESTKEKSAELRAPQIQSLNKRFGATELMQASIELLKSRAPEVDAQDLIVQLPQGDSLSASQVPVMGKTRSNNRIYLNGVETRVSPDGQFVGSALIGDDGILEVKSVDVDGNSATITKAYKVADRAWFLLALGESTTGALGSELDGIHAHTSTTVGDQIYVHGRAVAYFKGRMKGENLLGGLFKKYEVTAHLDTAKQQEFESYFRQMIDPNRYYPVYGDSAQEVMDVNSRGPLYVLLKADKSMLQAGNFRTLIKGIELLTYDRSLYGAQVSLDVSQGEWRHQAQVFGATQDQPERHAYVELRGTGGSLYYLPHRELVEGSERIYVVERDRISNMERRRVALVRNQDYSIRYLDGRILMLRPINSTTMDTVGALPQPTGSQVVLDGHPTFISIEYDHRDAQDRGEDAWGAYVRETWSDKKNKQFSVGGGFIQEQQGEVAQGHYRLWGGHLTYQHARKTGFAVEYAKSLNQNAENLFSQDGGLTFQPFSRRAPGESSDGDSFLVKANVELDDLIGKGDQDWVWLEGYWRYATPGFYAGGNLQQQGTENYGFKANYRLNEHHLITLTYDEMATEQTPLEVNPFVTDFRRQITRIGHQYSEGKLTLDTAWTSTQNEQSIDTEGNAPPVFSSDVVSSAIQYKLTSKFTLLGEQEMVIRGDRRLFEKTSDLFVTSLGARYKLSEALQLEGVQSLRWSGDNATQLGIRSELDDRRTMYAQQRMIDQFGRKMSTTVIGGEERFAQGARAFSEYQIESGQLGQRNRAVLGIGKRTQLIKGLTIDANYQRSQVLNNFSGMATGSGDLSQDSLSVGIEWLAHPQIKLSSRLELRYDDADEWLGQRDKNQVLTLNNLSYQATPDLTLQLRFNYSITEDEIFKETEAEFLEASFGAAYRPLNQRWLAILFKATSRFEQRPVDLTFERPEIEEMGVISLIPIFELPFNFQLVEKIAYKRSAIIVENLSPTVSHNLLWINRLNYHLTDTWDIGAEYRLLQNSLSQSTLHGALFELNYIIKKTIRVGAGYNFTRFTDDEFARFDEQYGGPFFRVMAQY